MVKGVIILKFMQWLMFPGLCLSVDSAKLNHTKIALERDIIQTIFIFQHDDECVHVCRSVTLCDYGGLRTTFGSWISDLEMKLSSLVTFKPAEHLTAHNYSLLQNLMCNSSQKEKYDQKSLSTELRDHKCLSFSHGIYLSHHYNIKF